MVHWGWEAPGAPAATLDQPFPVLVQRRRSKGVTKNRSRFWLTLVITAVAVGAICLWLWRAAEGGFDWQKVATAFRNLNYAWIAASIVLAILTYVGRALRWAVLIKPIKPKPNLVSLFNATVIGFTALVLFGRPGEFVRPYLIAVKERLPVASQFAAWTLERVFDLLAALLIFGIALSSVQSSGVATGPTVTRALEVGGSVVWILSVACIVALWILANHAETMKRRLLDALALLPADKLHAIEGLADAFVKGVTATRHKSSMLLIVGYTVLEWILISGCYYAIFRAFPALDQLGLVDALIFLGFVAFGAVVQLPGIGGGVQVVSVVVLRELFQIPLEVASSIAVVIWVITFVVIVPIGIPIALREGLNWKRLRALDEQAAKAVEEAKAS